jgi:DUF4097 and DUF4098 domain-containing protein YvlB
MRRHLRYLAVPTALIAALSIPAHAQESRHESFPFQPGQRLEAKLERGDIEYRPGSAARLEITVSVDNGKIADVAEVRFMPGASGLLIEADALGNGATGVLSWLFGGSNDSKNHLKFVVEGPARADLALSTSGGDVRIGDVEGKAVLATSGGNITFGAVTGTLTAATSGGDVGGRMVTGPATLATSGGNIRIETGGEGLKMRTSGGDIAVGSADGPIELATSGGNIRVGDSPSDVSASTSGGDVEVGRIGGSLKVATSGGNVRIVQAGGDGNVTTSGGDISIGEAAGRLKAFSSGGNLMVTLADGNDAGGTIGTSGGLLTVRIPTGLGLDIDANARGGRIMSTLAFSTSTAEAKDRLVATLAGGGNLLTLRNEDGDIRIEAAQSR